MRRTEIIWKWIKVLILASLAVYLSVMVCGFAGFAWSESRHNFTHAVIDPRSLEHLELFYIAVLFLVVLGLLLSLTIAGLVRTLCPSKQPGIITKHLRQYGLYMAPAFVVLFVAFRFFFRIIEHNASVLRNTSEFFPVHEIVVYNVMAMAASVSLLAAIISFISGIIGIIKKKSKKRKRVRLPAVFSNGSGLKFTLDIIISICHNPGNIFRSPCSKHGLLKKERSAHGRNNTGLFSVSLYPFLQLPESIGGIAIR